MAFHHAAAGPLSTYAPRQYLFDEGAYYSSAPPEPSSSTGLVTYSPSSSMLPPPSRPYPEQLTFPPMMPFDPSSASASAYTAPTAQHVLDDSIHYPHPPPPSRSWQFPFGRTPTARHTHSRGEPYPAPAARRSKQGSNPSHEQTAGASVVRTGYFRSSDLDRSSPNEQRSERSHYVPQQHPPPHHYTTNHHLQQISPPEVLYRPSHQPDSPPEAYLLPPLQQQRPVQQQPTLPTMAPLEQRAPQFNHTPPHSPHHGRYHSNQDSISSASSTLISSPETRHSPSSFSNHSPELHQALIAAPSTLLPSPDLSVSVSPPTRPQADDDLNLIPSDGIDGSTTTGSGGSPAAKASIFECPGCDLTFTRLSALKQVRRPEGPVT